jgi:protein-S-isoprenylcysteine O-methyltransferase Ste14
MTQQNSSKIWKILYAVLFAVVLPVLLVAWAKLTESCVHLSALGSYKLGLVLAIVGAAITVSGIVTLSVQGDGLPMSPFPPRRYVSRGVYGLIPHPIYTGFCILWIGYVMAGNSASGLWLVSPVVILASFAFVQGFEKHQLRERFGPAVVKPFIHIPAHDSVTPNLADRLSVYVLIFVPCLLACRIVGLLGISQGSAPIVFPFERDLPVYEWTDLFYASAYLLVLITPLVAKSKQDLREFSIKGLIATGMIILLVLADPYSAAARPHSGNGLLAAILAWERGIPSAAAGSLHIVWAFLAARAFSGRRSVGKILGWGWASLITISCITTGMHGVIDVLIGLVVFWIVIRLPVIWEHIRQLSELIANSWREWHFGPVRLINHGIYAGVGTLLGFSIIGIFIGPEHNLSILIVALCSLVGAALWAQHIEGSSRLLRPYGFYGGVLGVILGAIIAHTFGTNAWLLLGSFSVAGPWIQSWGRLRCLVQGCCHGREAAASVGIRCVHPQSRVTRLSDLEGVPIHPTPVYSILWNVVVAIIITRLWRSHAALPLIAGVYLILTGLGRFIEESYRGEPQTPIIAGLRLYQWTAIASVVIGAAVTTFESTIIVPEPQFSWSTIAAAIGFGIFTCFALGVDFPRSDRRFARLA